MEKLYNNFFLQILCKQHCVCAVETFAPGLSFFFFKKKKQFHHFPALIMCVYNSVKMKYIFFMKEQQNV